MRHCMKIPNNDSNNLILNYIVKIIENVRIEMKCHKCMGHNTLIHFLESDTIGKGILIL